MEYGDIINMTTNDVIKKGCVTMSEKLFLGVAREIITPEVGTCLYGYVPDLHSTEVNDDLTATAFYFKQGDKSALMISVTVCSIRLDICDYLRATIESELGVAKENCLIHAIHTHSGPNVAGHDGWGEVDEEYRDSIFIPKVLEAARKAVASPVPVKMGIAFGDSLVGINRREFTRDNHIAFGQNPWGVFNPKMVVTSFVNEEGKNIANIVHYGAHCTASGKNTQISRDWPGVMIDTLDAVTGGITAFFNGPEGDVGPRMPFDHMTEGKRHVKYAIQIGGVAAQDAVRIYKQINTYTDADLSVFSKDIKLPLKPRLSKEEALEKLQAFEGKDVVNVEAGTKKYLELVVDSYSNGYEEKEALDIPQSIVKVGGVAFVSCPFELFSEIGMRINLDSDIPHVLTLSNTNDARGYLCTKDQLCRGGYEVQMHTMAHVQAYSDDADYAIVKGTLENLKEL